MNNGIIAEGPKGTRGRCPQDFGINKEVPFQVFIKMPLLFEEKVLWKRRASKFEMLPTTLNRIKETNHSFWHFVHSKV